MQKQFSRRPSPATIIALLALAVALTGTAYAADKLNGRNLVARSVPGAKLKMNTLTGTEINESKLAGVSASSLANIRYVRASAPVEFGQFASATWVTAYCPASAHDVIGGGAELSDPFNGAYVIDSYPQSTRFGWSARALASQGGTTLTVTAICADAP